MDRYQWLPVNRGTRRRTGLTLALAAMLTAGCGDGRSSSGVDGDKSLGELSPDESTDLCEWGQSQFDGDAFNRFTCYSAAILASPDQETCEEVAQECLDEAEPLEPGAGECRFDAFPECASDVSVAEFEACFRDTLDLLQELAEVIDCDISLDDLEDLDAEQPASCQLVEEKCPELFEDDDEDGEQTRTTTVGPRDAIRWARRAARAATESGPSGP